jgi:hypothetical protein
VPKEVEMTENGVLYQVKVKIEGIWEVKHETTDEIDACAKLNQWHDVGFEVFIEEIHFPKDLQIERKS